MVNLNLATKPFLHSLSYLSTSILKHHSKQVLNFYFNQSQTGFKTYIQLYKKCILNKIYNMLDCHTSNMYMHCSPSLQHSSQCINRHNSGWVKQLEYHLLPSTEGFLGPQTVASPIHQCLSRAFSRSSLSLSTIVRGSSTNPAWIMALSYNC